jgi:acyl-CoA thioesterase
MTDAFYVDDGERFVATEHTRGPWSPVHQHAGPPAALMARALERAAPELMLARVTVDLLRPVPIAALTVRTETLRAGKKVQRLRAFLLAGDDLVAHAMALLIRTQPVALPPARATHTLPPPDSVPPFQFPFFRDTVGYHHAMETRMEAAAFGTGDVTAWMRRRLPLLSGETPSPMQRILIAADSASGVSAMLDHARFTFVNSDLTVAVHRPLEGEWIGMRAVTTPQAHGVGLTDTQLFDTHGPLGRVVQSLLIEARSPTGR